MRLNVNFLSVAGMCTLVAALMHLGCIIFGASWYRFMGAGEQMAILAESGDIRPMLTTLSITIVLLLWTVYAFSGAGKWIRLPCVRLVLMAISAVLILRGFGFYFLMPSFPDNSLTFWWISSGICALVGLLYALGIKQSWQYLSGGVREMS